MVEPSNRSNPVAGESETNPSTVESESNPLAVVTENHHSAGRDGSSPCATLTLIFGVVTALATIAGFLIQQSFHLPGPRCSIQQLYVPALDMSAPPPQNISTINPFLFFVLGLENNLQIRSISYGNVMLTFYYGRKAVGGYVVPGFFQGRLRAAQRRDVVETRGVPWEDAVGAVSGGGTASFRVELAAQPRFKILFWYSKEKKVRIVADVAVDGSGLKVGRADVVMHKIEDSRASERRIRVSFLFASVLVVYCMLH